jgi:hypothetical protein
MDGTTLLLTEKGDAHTKHGIGGKVSAKKEAEFGEWF